MLPEIWSATDIIFCPFTTKLKFGKNDDIILLNMCTINEYHMMYVS